MTSGLGWTLLVFGAAVAAMIVCCRRAAADNERERLYEELGACFEQLASGRRPRRRELQEFLREALMNPRLREGLRQALRHADKHWPIDDPEEFRVEMWRRDHARR